VREPLGGEETGEAQAPLSGATLAIPRERLVLMEALRERDDRLAAIYEGVVHMMARLDLPDRLSLAAHAMRELMERLPLAFDVPIDEKSRVLDRVREVEATLAQAHTKSSCRTSDGWQGRIDGPMTKLLASVEKLVEERRRYWPSRAEVAVELINRLEPALGRRSAPLVKTEAQEWAGFRRYFEQVSHHHHVFESFETSASEFEDRVRKVESLLLNKLRPPTAEDFEAIDRLMGEFMEPADD
jgi:hypothetical protein